MRGIARARARARPEEREDGQQPVEKRLRKVVAEGVSNGAVLVHDGPAESRRRDVEYDAELERSGGHPRAAVRTLEIAVDVAQEAAASGRRYVSDRAELEPLVAVHVRLQDERHLVLEEERL